MNELLQGLKAFLKNTYKTELIVALGLVGIIFIMLMPLPGFILDFLLALNLTLSLLIILTVLFSRRALDFSLFPTLLLVVTVFNLALNISSTRLILLEGENFSSQIILAFSSFVVGTQGLDGLIIGFLIFVILIAVQFVVITKGATRVAEVAARFTLDALPGKQMAIDAAYNSGSLSDEEAKEQKKDLQAEVSFYGAMDGASKFVSGNVKVGIFILLINSIGGIVLGTSLRGETFTGAMGTYVRLTVGDGLVAQIPALLISVATGLLVTRTISGNTFAGDIVTQFSRQANIYWIGSFFLLVLAFVPGFPTVVLLLLASLLFYTGYSLSRTKEKTQTVSESGLGPGSGKDSLMPTEVSPVVLLDLLSLEIGYGLIPLVDQGQGAELLNRITKIRKETALDLGLILPKIRILDNMQLQSWEYQFKLKGVLVGKGELRVGSFLAINPGNLAPLEGGEPTKDPAFGLDALWIEESLKTQAESKGYTVVDAPSILATHLSEIIRKHASELLGKQEVQTLLDKLKENYGVVIDEVKKIFSVGEIQKILQNLLKEQVSIRDIITILEVLSDYGALTKDIHFLSEKIRQGLSRQLTMRYADENRVLSVISIEPSLEEKLISSKVETAQGPLAALVPMEQKRWVQAVLKTLPKVQNLGLFPVLLCSEAARPLVKTSLKRDLPDLVVLSVPEVDSSAEVKIVAEVALDEENGSLKGPPRSEVDHDERSEDGVV